MTPAKAGPPNDETLAVGAAQGFRGQAETNTNQSSSDDSRKEVDTATARLALLGFSLHELAGGGFLIARYDRVLHAPDLRSVQAFQRRMEETRA